MAKIIGCKNNFTTENIGEEFAATERALRLVMVAVVFVTKMD